MTSHQPSHLFQPSAASAASLSYMPASLLTTSPLDAAAGPAGVSTAATAAGTRSGSDARKMTSVGDARRMSKDIRDRLYSNAHLLDLLSTPDTHGGAKKRQTTLMPKEYEGVVALVSGDSYVHADVFLMRGLPVVLLLSRNQLNVIDANKRRVLLTFDLVSVHAVEDSEDPFRLVLVMRTQEDESKLRKRFFRGSKKDVMSTLSERSFVAGKRMQVQAWVTLLRSLLRDLWQKVFERAIVPAPEVYQFHQFVSKKNEHGGKLSERVLLLSSHRVVLTHIHIDPFEVHSPQWSTPFTNIRSVGASQSTREVFVLNFETPIATGKRAVVFYAKDEGERFVIAHEISRLVFRATGRKALVSIP